MLLVVGNEVEEVVDSVAFDVTDTSGIVTFVVASEIAFVVLDKSVDETDGAVEAESLTELCASVVLGTGVVGSEETLNRGSGLTVEVDAVSAYRSKRKSDKILDKCY